MLSNPNGLHARQRQHRRQQSTPTAFDGVKIPQLPNTTRRQAAGHRRGYSLDVRRQHQQNSTSPTTRQQLMVSTNTNNTGLASTSQHFLREAQQQRIQARPGTQNPYVTLAASGSENYLISPHGTPQEQRFDPSCFDPNNIPFDAYNSELNVMMGKSQAAYGDNMSGGNDFDFNTSSATSTPTFIHFQESPSSQGWTSEPDTSSTRRVPRRISNEIMDRVSRYENLASDSAPSRPITPPNGSLHNYYPPSPMGTPQDPSVKVEQTPSRFQDGYDESMEETIKPVRNRGGNRRAQTIFQDLRQQSEQQQQQQQQQPIAPKINSMPEANNFHGLPMSTPDYLSMNNFGAEFLKIENTLDMNQSLPQSAPADPSQMAQFVGDFNSNPELNPYPLDAQSLAALPSSCPSGRGSPHRRTESLASIQSAASIAGINIEETKTDTGVTLEEISQFIQGPDAADGKWMCLYEDCGKKFGRKENIKSHVQTHLNDRQYQCPTCRKCFVRQHDLKRHAKIHTGIKPYPCECGNSFARHDALTRHRQRGMCIGAFDGVVRKVVKRGRPKKNRPDMDVRREKSTRTRKKNMSVSSMSSFSGYSDSSAVNSPDAGFAFDDIMDIGMSEQNQNIASASSAPMTSIPAQEIPDMATSPSAGSAHSCISPEALMEGTPVNPTSPAKSAAGSQYNTPPDLSESSSPTPAQIFEVDPNTSLNTDDLSTITGTSAIMGHSGMNGTLPLGMSDYDSDMLHSFNDEDLIQLDRLDRDANALLLSKFDEEFDNAVMFNSSNDDIFFGNA